MNNSIEPVQGGRSLFKAILQAVAILAITALLAQAIVFPMFQDRLLEPVQKWEVEYLNGGVAALLADEINGVTASERVEWVDRIAPLFGFDVSILEIGRVGLSTDDLVRLRAFEVVGDASSYSVHKLLNGGEQVLVLRNTKLPAAHLPTEGQRRHMGALAMLQRVLQGQPEENWQALVEAKAPWFDYPVGLVPAEEMDLTHAQLDALRNGRIVTVETEASMAADYPAELAYQQVGESVLFLGPLSGPTLKRFYPTIAVYYALLATIIFLPLGLWLAPTWRSMNQLSSATVAFGHGDFSARAAPIRGSKSNHLIDVFNQMAGKIQSLIDSNKTLINAVSHELRTPISRIEFNIELARQSDDISERNRQLDRIEGSVDELKTMVSEMLQYARFDREKPSFTMKPVDVAEWLNSERENWHQGRDNVDVQVIVPEKRIRAAMERYYMSRAISNLVRNATRFAKSKVVVEVSIEGGNCDISVCDDGPGVDYQERARIFEPFARHDQSRSRESGGTGLGLAIVRQIVGWHAGEVWVEDSKLGGAQFVVRWPIAAEDAE